MTNADADKITAEFDNNISPKITSVFGQPSDTDEDGKIDILCYDIKDGFSGSGGYYAGYFDPNDLYENTSGNPYPYDTNPNSNQSEVFYIDVYPGMGTGTPKDVTQCYGTIAHEFQHMVNWNQNVFIENNDPDTVVNSTWLNETLSEAASQVYSGNVSSSRISYYNSSSTITSGSSLLRWTSTLDNYSLAYLFSQYVKEQVGIGDAVFTEIIQSTYNDYHAVEQVIQKYIDPTITFGRFMTYFRTALLLKRATGLYGFKGNTDYNSIVQKIYGGNKTNLYGGGAVIIEANHNTGEVRIPSNKGATVYYFILQNPPVVTITPYQTAPTNQNIIVTAATDIGTLNATSHTFTENGSFDFVSTNLMGDTSTQTVTISNIDKVAPIVNGVSDGGIYNVAIISFSDGSAVLNASPCINDTVVRVAGNYSLSVIDAVGNETSLNFTINETLYKYAPGYITGLSLNTAMSDFVSNANILANETVKAFDSDNTEIIDTESMIGTGATMKIFSESVLVDTYSVVIYGDASGDGDIGIDDLASVKQHVLNSALLSGAYQKAGDINKNGTITISDLLSVKMHLIGIQFISQA
jgi:hypothetical protein